jgi:hypothetical protein
MSFLGCNSKNLWHDIFSQIVDIISVKHDKIGIIVCKNFHMIHNELLDIFYSYIQQFNSTHMNIQVKFVIITEHISFIPCNIINTCAILNIKKPDKRQFIEMLKSSTLSMNNNSGSLNSLKEYSIDGVMNDEKDTMKYEVIGKASHYDMFPSKEVKNILSIEMNEPENTILKMDQYNSLKKPVKHNQFIKKITCKKTSKESSEILNMIDTNTLINIKEIQSFSLIKSVGEIPKDIFNIICDQIITEITVCEKINFVIFRDLLYDILIYNLDVIECVWYILTHFIEEDKLASEDISDIINKTYLFLKYFNNNYRPIYHLESMIFYLIKKIKKYGHDKKCKISKNK